MSATHVDDSGNQYKANPNDPFGWLVWRDGQWHTVGALFGVRLQSIAMQKPDHTDELGKVWDVLHANGINGAEGLSASEGVEQLAVAHRLALDELIYGNSFATVDERGLKTRIDPRAMVINMPSRIKP